MLCIIYKLGEFRLQYIIMAMSGLFTILLTTAENVYNLGSSPIAYVVFITQIQVGAVLKR